MRRRYVREQPRGGLDRVPRSSSCTSPAPRSPRCRRDAVDVHDGRRAVPVTTAVFVPSGEQTALAVAVKAGPEVRAQFLDAKWLEAQVRGPGRGDP